MTRLLARPSFSHVLSAWADNISRTGRVSKQLVAVGADLLIASAALWLAYSLRLGAPFDDFRPTWYLFALLSVTTVGVFAAFGIYRWVVRSINGPLFRQLVKACVVSALCLVLITYFLPPDRSNPRSLSVIYGLLLVAGTIGARLAWQGLFDAGGRGMPIAIYGAGLRGRRFANSLYNDAEYRAVLLIDDDPTLAGSTVAGLPVVHGDSDRLLATLRSHEVECVVLAEGALSITDHERRVRRLEALGVPIQTIPSVAELLSGSARPGQIRDVSINDILGRREVVPDRQIMGRCVSGRSVLVTGGGGSIGSELCRQVMALKPSRLVLLELCEANLYHVTEELRAALAQDGSGAEVKFVPVLGSVTDAALIDELMAVHDIDTVYHAAAYKHVPIVEDHPERGVDTNVLGTLQVLRSSIAHGVDDFVLISTDKAVRPTNVMGATKRTAELVLQALAPHAGSTCVSMVRFGNVLGSSGSVVPKFKRQILADGPITLTHPDITRYFMTIPEAAQLVLQAGGIARGGDVFVLDMGEPVRILDLARSMVRLYGKGLREETGRAGDIEIVIEGLRPGEKMYEELFLSGERLPTGVSKLFTAKEIWLDWKVLEPRIQELREATERRDSRVLRRVLHDLAFIGERPDGVLSTVDRAAPAPVRTASREDSMTSAA